MSVVIWGAVELLDLLAAAGTPPVRVGEEQ
jgi:hypothetical protein